MPKKIMTGSGMMQREHLQFAPDEWRELSEHLRTLDWKGPDETRAQNAKHVRQTLEAAAAKVTPAQLAAKRRLPEEIAAHWMQADPFGWMRAYFGEGDAFAIFAEWLAAFDRLERARNAEPPDLQTVIMWAEECGRLQKELYWRPGVDRETGKKREDLAYSGKLQITKGDDTRRKRTENSFKQKHGAEAQRYAQGYLIRNPNASWSQIRGAIAKRFKVSEETVKKSIQNPKKTG